MVKFQGKIEVICGPMFSGKTEELIRRIKRLTYSNTDYMVFKPRKDVRYGDFNIATHDKVSFKATPVETAEQIFQWCDQNSHVKTIAVDEAQFFDKAVNEGEKTIVEVCQLLRARGYRIIITGLDMDHLGNPFGFMPQLMALADNVEKLTSICFVCKEDNANMSLRLATNDDQFELGNDDKYQARCYKHWLEGHLEREVKKKKEIDALNGKGKKEEVNLKEANEQFEEVEKDEE